MGRGRIKELYYITHIDNVPSILKRGILSHERMQEDNIPYTRIYDEEIVTNRRQKLVPDGRSLWSFANLYFQPRNPMLYRVLCEKSRDDIVVLAVRQDILSLPSIFITDGNAASSQTRILPMPQSQNALPKIVTATRKQWWAYADDSKRTIMAECLVPDMITPDLIQGIYVVDYKVVDKVRAIVQQDNISVVHVPNLFFQPGQRIGLTSHLSLVDGDMFFSGMQTLTVSVNCVGVMGKGLASRAKYQFPDVYVHYQDLCRKRKLQMGKPYLYKSESPFVHQLADEPLSLSNANLETWFLLFPTKNHWRYNADIDGIEKGLQWLRDNYRNGGIKSLAIPALGCGLGKLEWGDVGPLMCRYLAAMDIPVWIYLPAEKKVPDELLTKEFLLTEKS